jgi:hypothetical protein
MTEYRIYTELEGNPENLTSFTTDMDTAVVNLINELNNPHSTKVSVIKLREVEK